MVCYIYYILVWNIQIRKFHISVLFTDSLYNNDMEIWRT